MDKAKAEQAEQSGGSERVAFHQGTIHKGGTKPTLLLFKLREAEPVGSLGRELCELLAPFAAGDRRDIRRVAEHMVGKGGAKATIGGVVLRACRFLDVLDVAQRENAEQRRREARGLRLYAVKHADPATVKGDPILGRVEAMDREQAAKIATAAKIGGEGVAVRLELLDGPAEPIVNACVNAACELPCDSEKQKTAECFEPQPGDFPNKPADAKAKAKGRCSVCGGERLLANLVDGVCRACRKRQEVG